MVKHATSWGIAVAAALGLVLAGCKHESEAKDTKGATQFELRAPSDQSITAGTTNKVHVSVDRKEYKGEIAITIDGLPSGITLLNPGPIPVGWSEMDYNLEAKTDAPAVDGKMCTVRAKGGGAETSQQFKVTVKPK